MTKEEFAGIVCGRIFEAYYDYAHVSNLAYEAMYLGMESIQIFPNTLARLGSMLGCCENRPALCAVIAYPHGVFTPSQKAFEISDAAACGADQFEFAINTVAARSGSWDSLREEFRACRQAAGSHVLKAIIEVEYLRDNELERVCKIAEEERIDRISTSIGVYTGMRGGIDGVIGVEPSDIEKIKKYCGVAVSAMGCVRTAEQCRTLLSAGADYICSEYAAELIRSWS